MEQPVEINITINRIVLQGEDPERLVRLLVAVREGYALDSSQKQWARALLEELKEESWR